MSMPKYLEKIREQYIDSYKNISDKLLESQPKKNKRMAFDQASCIKRKAFNYAAAIVLTDLEEIANALDEILLQDKERAELTFIAREALAKYREKYGR